jgi:hypothetical protein
MIHRPSPTQFFHTFGEGEGGGEKPLGTPFLPLTLILSRKGRGDNFFDNREYEKRKDL